MCVIAVSNKYYTKYCPTKNLNYFLVSMRIKNLRNLIKKEND